MEGSGLSDPTVDGVAVVASLRLVVGVSMPLAHELKPHGES